MCRLLCYMGDVVPMELLVTKPEHSLVFQSRDASFHPGCHDKRNIRVNGDGFGLAWYAPSRMEEGACLLKFATPAWSSSNLLNVAKYVESGLVFAHVRAASDGNVLTGNVNYENTHPFKYKRYTFMHNGGIVNFSHMKRQLLSLLGDEAYAVIEGTTDSEACFAFFLDELPNTDDQLTAAEIAEALHRTITRLVSAVWRFSQPCARARPRNRGNHAEAATPTMSLNFCVSDGRHMVCTRYRNHPRQDPPSLFCLTGAGFACDEHKSCFRVTASEPRTSVVISSEPLCRSTKDWQLIPRNTMVIVEGAPCVVDGGVVRQGLASSIRLESLRCHPSDGPDAVPQPYPRPSSTQGSFSSVPVTLGRSARNSRASSSPSIGGANIPGPRRLDTPPEPLCEESVNVSGCAEIIPADVDGVDDRFAREAHGSCNDAGVAS